MSRVHLLGLSLAFTSLTVAGCDDARTECELGDTQACTCSDGTAGTQICTAAGEFSGCMCGTPMIDAGPGMDAGRDAGRDAGPDEDSGIVIMMDSGTDTDGGTTDTDGGTTGTDSGTTGTDSGTTGTDGGTTGTDGGTTGTDGGTDAGSTGTDGGLCGNGTCDTAAGETNASCAADCPLAACAAIGDPCGAGAQPSGFVCIGGECEATCTDSSTCAAGSECDAAGYCRRSECTSFFADDCADSGRDCIPVSSDTNWCILNGAGAAGDTCAAHNECGDGLLCAGGTCFAPECGPVTGTPACGGGQTCSGFTAGGMPIDIGVCTCTPFTSGTCPSGEWCVPSTGTEGVGFCAPPAGAGALGDACSGSSLCAADLLCIGGQCSSLCYASAASGTPGSCADGVCAPLVDADDNPLAFGYCDPAACVPFTSGTCPSGEWCLPDSGVEGIGVCVPPDGAGAEGDPCSDAIPSCGADLLCIDDVCSSLCYGSASAGTPGSCASGSACFGLVDTTTGDPFAFGVCLSVDSCGFDEGTPMCTAPDVCAAGELLASGEDTCLNIENVIHGAACTGADLDFCNGLGVCLSGTCTDICRESAGAFNGGPHPDCPSGTVCLGDPGDEISICG